MEFGVALALGRGYFRAIGSNDPRLTPMYNKYGYYTLRRVPISNNKSIECISDVVFADFRHLPEPTFTNVRRIARRLISDLGFCICPKEHCYTQGHPLEGTRDCPRTNYFAARLRVVNH